jgi:hypothetical protein
VPPLPDPPSFAPDPNAPAAAFGGSSFNPFPATGATASAGGTGTAGAGQGGGPSLPSVPVADVVDNKAVRVGAALALVALAGWLWFVSSNREPVLRFVPAFVRSAVTGADRDRPRGIGRFVRERVTPPTPL